MMKHDIQALGTSVERIGIHLGAMLHLLLKKGVITEREWDQAVAVATVTFDQHQSQAIQDFKGRMAKEYPNVAKAGGLLDVLLGIKTPEDLRRERGDS